MSSITAIPDPLQRIASNPLWLRQFSVSEYHKMIEAGILGPDDRVELVEGWIVKKMSQNPPHPSCVTRIVRRVGRCLPDDWTLRVQAPVTLSESEPEPDITLARGAEETYDRRHPRVADLGVLIEVGDSTFLSDRRYKGVLYAKAKVPEFWLVNVVKRQIEVYAKPRAGKYQKPIAYSENQSIPLILDGEKIADIPVSELIAKS